VAFLVLSPALGALGGYLRARALDPGVTREVSRRPRRLRLRVP
jgi:hypothetical protein